MQIWHRITFKKRDNVEPDLQSLSIAFTKSDLPGGSYVLHIEIAESDPKWRSVVDLRDRNAALDVFNTVYSKDEIISSTWVRICPSFEQGYPQPQDEPSWEEQTLAGACGTCGVGARQVAPFRVLSEPKLGKREFVSLVGTYSLFSTLSVAEEISGLNET